MTYNFTSCHEDVVMSSEKFPSYRDGLFEGKNLKVTLNGKEIKTVEFVKINSNLLDPNVDTDIDTTTVVGSANPIYWSSITIKGFPTEKETQEFVTISTLQGFEGLARINRMWFEYEGEFTGDPLMHHDNQGLILNFYLKEE